MQLQIFKYQNENHLDDLTTVEIDGEIWFSAPDVCALLEIKNVSDAVSTLEDDEKLVSEIPRAGQTRKVNLVNESGLYALIFKSKKDSAKRFRKWVTKEVLPSIRKTGSYGINRIETPNFILRYMENFNKIPIGSFSVITELYVRLYARFEHVGYKIPNKAIDGKEIRPDVSVGKCFAAYLRANFPSAPQEFETYTHTFPSGFECEARLYPNHLLPIFIQYVDEEWIPSKAEDYFYPRDRKALDFLPRLLPAS